jgi:hypothetical protein
VHLQPRALAADTDGPGRRGGVSKVPGGGGQDVQPRPACPACQWACAAHKSGGDAGGARCGPAIACRRATHEMMRFRSVALVKWPTALCWTEVGLWADTT